VHDVAGGRIWWCVGLDQRERLVAGEDQLDGSYHDAAKRIATDLSQAGPRRRLAGEAAEGGRVEGVAGQRSREVRVAPTQTGVERRRTGDMLLYDQIGELARAHVEAVRGGRPALFDG